MLVRCILTFSKSRVFDTTRSFSYPVVEFRAVTGKE